MDLKFKGKVVKNLGRGTELGFPTANLDAKTDLEEGIYLGKVRIQNSSQLPLLQKQDKGEFLPSLIFIGAAQTFGETRKLIEVYILDFQEDIYGQELRVEILKKIRENMKFDSAEQLTEQMKRDEAEAREYFKTGSPLARG